MHLRIPPEAREALEASITNGLATIVPKRAGAGAE